MAGNPHFKTNTYRYLNSAFYKDLSFINSLHLLVFITFYNYFPPNRLKKKLLNLPRWDAFISRLDGQIITLGRNLPIQEFQHLNVELRGAGAGRRHPEVGVGVPLDNLNAGDLSVTAWVLVLNLSRYDTSNIGQVNCNKKCTFKYVNVTKNLKNSILIGLSKAEKPDSVPMYKIFF